MRIDVVWGCGEGNTPLGSFDRALSKAGLHNYNLVKISSIIPPNSKVKKSGSLEKDWRVGELVGAVISRYTSTDSEKKIVSGLGWSVAEEGGIFMEVKGREREECEERVLSSLEDSMKLRDWNWHTKFETKIVEHIVDQTASALVVAVYSPIPKVDEISGKGK